MRSPSPESWTISQLFPLYHYYYELKHKKSCQLLSVYKTFMCFGACLVIWLPFRVWLFMFYGLLCFEHCPPYSLDFCIVSWIVILKPLLSLVCYILTVKFSWYLVLAYCVRMVPMESCILLKHMYTWHAPHLIISNIK